MMHETLEVLVSSMNELMLLVQQQHQHRRGFEAVPSMPTAIEPPPPPLSQQQQPSIIEARRKTAM
jgi:hypothetical protein